MWHFLWCSCLWKIDRIFMNFQKHFSFIFIILSIMSTSIFNIIVNICWQYDVYKRKWHNLEWVVDTFTWFLWTYCYFGLHLLNPLKWWNVTFNLRFVVFFHIISAFPLNVIFLFPSGCHWNTDICDLVSALTFALIEKNKVGKPKVSITTKQQWIVFPGLSTKTVDILFW